MRVLLSPVACGPVFVNTEVLQNGAMSSMDKTLAVLNFSAHDKHMQHACANVSQHPQQI